MIPHRHCALCVERALDSERSSAPRPATGAGAARDARRTWRRDVRASMNALTLLITVAGLAAAGAAAGFLLDTADSLRDTGSQASDDATAAAAVGYVTVLDVYGDVHVDRVGVVRELVTLAPLAETADLSTVTLILRVGDGRATFAYGEAPAADRFTVAVLSDADGSCAGPRPVLNQGDLVEWAIPASDAGLVIQRRSHVEQSLVIGPDFNVTDSFDAPSVLVPGAFADFVE